MKEDQNLPYRHSGLHNKSPAAAHKRKPYKALEPDSRGSALIKPENHISKRCDFLVLFKPIRIFR